jgi:polysaccharide biosynthesis transport protein
MPDEQSSASSGLPFEPITVLIGLIRRWKIFLAIVALSAGLGIVAGYALGSQTYETGNISLYKVPDVKDQAASRFPPLSTQAQMVLIPDNLRVVAEKLQLNMRPTVLEAAYKVRVEKKTSLLYITANWDSPKMAADLANSLRDIFFENQMRLIKADAGKDMKDLEVRVKKADAEFKQADAKLQTFFSENKIVDVGKEVQGNLDRLSSMEVLSSNSKNERDTLETQRKTLKEKMQALEGQLAKEQSAASQTKGLADLNIRIERLRRAIHDDREDRKNRVELGKDELAYERAKELFDKGLISKQDFQKAKAEYEVQEVKANDTDQIAEWKRQLKALESEVIPQKEDFKSPTQELYRSLQLKIMDSELQEVSLENKIAYIDDQISKVRAKLEVLIALQRQIGVLNKDASAKEAKKRELDALLEKARRDYETTDAGFVVVSDAQVPSQSIKSNRKIFFAAVAFLGIMAGSMVILASELLDTTIKSAAEVQNKFSKPVVGIIPKMKPGEPLLPDKPNFQLIEMFRMIGVRIRRDLPKRGARIMITSADRWEGRTLVTANLAACLGRQDERVLVMDAQVRQNQSELDLRYMIAEKEKPLKGLGEWLSFDVLEFEQIVWPTVLPGVECIPRVEAAVTPDLLGSIRMKELMETLSEHFSIILVDGPPVGTYVDAELVARCCDAVIFVVRSRTCTSSALKRSVERIGEAGVPLAGFVVNDIDRLYLKWA